VHDEKYAFQVFVRDNDIDQALRVLREEMIREGMLREIKTRRANAKPSELRAQEKA